jgi:hypothetical protein
MATSSLYMTFFIPTKQRFFLHNDERPLLPINGAGRLNHGANELPKCLFIA